MQSRAHVRDPLPVRPSLSILRSTDMFSRIRQIGQSVDSERLFQHKRRPAPIPSLEIADYCGRSTDLRSWPPTCQQFRSLRAVDLRGDVAKNLGRGCILWRGNGAKSFCPSCWDYDNNIPAERRNIAAIGIRYFSLGTCLIPLDFSPAVWNLARQIISRAKRTKNILFSPSSFCRSGGEDRFKRSS